MFSATSTKSEPPQKGGLPKGKWVIGEVPSPVVLICSVALHGLLASVLLRLGHSPPRPMQIDPIEFALIEPGSGGARPAAPPPLLGNGEDGSGGPAASRSEPKLRVQPQAKKTAPKTATKLTPKAPEKTPADEGGVRLASLTPTGATSHGIVSDAGAAPSSVGTAGGHPSGSTAGSADGVVGGVVGGVAGGVVGGVVGGTGTGGGTGSRFVAPNVAMGQRLFSPDPPYTVAAQSAGIEGTVTAKICVNEAGNVSGVTLMRHMAMGMDASVVDTVKTWRFRPFVYNGRAVPFCYISNFVYALR